jgi:hypothetical protein
MPSNETTAAAPIATGVLLVGTAAREVIRHGFEMWTVLALAGGPSAVAVGFGVLTGLDGFDSDDDLGGYRDRTAVALASLALTCVTVGARLALA